MNTLKRMMVLCLCMWALGLAAEKQAVTPGHDKGTLLINTDIKAIDGVAAKQAKELQRGALEKGKLLKNQLKATEKVALIKEARATSSPKTIIVPNGLPVLDVDPLANNEIKALEKGEMVKRDAATVITPAEKGMLHKAAREGKVPVTPTEGNNNSRCVDCQGNDCTGYESWVGDVHTKT